jgi:TM2 domain-containing membrane protein YozV
MSIISELSVYESSRISQRNLCSSFARYDHDSVGMTSLNLVGDMVLERHIMWASCCDSEWKLHADVSIFLLKASQGKLVLFVRWHNWVWFGALRLQLLRVVQAWISLMVMVAVLPWSLCFWCGLSWLAPSAVQLASSPRKCLGAIPLAELAMKVRDIGGISVLQCPSMALAETRRIPSTQSATWAEGPLMWKICTPSNKY